MTIAREIATTIIYVLVSCLLVGYVFWRLGRVADRVSDPRYRRRALIWVAVFYIVVGVFIIVGVAARNERMEALYGLPVGAFIAWLLLRAAIKMQVPPSQ